EEHAAKGKAFVTRAFERGFDRFTNNSAKSLFVQNACARYSSHAAGVRPRVAFAYAFVIARSGHERVIAPVGKKEQRSFATRQRLFNDDLPCSFRADRSSQHQIVNGSFGLLA